MSQPPTAGPPPITGGHTILIVDDEPLARQRLRDLLTELGGVEIVGEAGNGRDAITLAQQLAADVVLLDIAMPVMDGLEATKRIKAQMDIPILALTASSMKGDQRIIEEICDRHLSKPIALPDLARALRDYLQIKPMAEAPASTAASEVEESESAPSDEALARWPELAGNLRREHSDVWPRLCDSPNITEVEEFAARLGEWATEFEAAPLARYAHTLQQHVENFDVEGMMETLKTFEEIVAQIEAQVLR